MSAKVVWNADATVGLVMRVAAIGSPYLGVVRYDDLCEAWAASSSMYAVPRDLGMFDTAIEATEAVIGEAVAVVERRTENARIAAAARAMKVVRIIGAGRPYADFPTFAGHQPRPQREPRVALHLDLVVTEATP